MAEPAERKNFFPVIARLVPLPARWWNLARWGEFVAALILWFGLMLLLHLATRSIVSDYRWHLR